MYAFIPGLIFLGVGVGLYRLEWKKEPETRSKANIMLASYACIIGVALGVVSILYWGEV
jgi:formate-dependent nitrite reductase membrane component NrfD